MSYMALYRKFRPESFDDVKGQDPIVTTLKNQIKADRIGHAYLFCGTRGTGKTTVAKIFARAVNCENPMENGPCGECASCRAIAAGTSMNVMEIDAASNNGVDNIREIRDEVAYPPTSGRFKVYIIDEVHMLSTGAFNALLKTLEEPPKYVIFILATTEADRIPVTILSRCQRYDFRRIPAETITARLKELTEKENVRAEERALRYVAKAADGSMRDALSLLDQCIAFYMDQELTYDRVLDVLGATDTEVYSRMLRATLSGDIPAIMAGIGDMAAEGKEFSRFVGDFTWYLRNLLLLKSSDGEMEDVLDMSSENLERLREEAGLVSSETLIRYIRIFSELSGQIKYSGQKRVQVEVAFIKLCRPQMETDNGSILERLRIMERRLDEKLKDLETGYIKASSGTATEPQGGGGTLAGAARSVKPVTPPPALKEDTVAVLGEWQAIISKTPNPLRNCLRTADLKALDDGRLCIVSQTETGEGILNEEQNISVLKEILQEMTGKNIDLVLAGPADDPAADRDPFDLESVVHMQIDYVD